MSQNTSRESSALVVGLVVLQVLGSVAVLWLLLRLVPQYEKLFKDFGVRLPTSTMLVIDLSRLFAKWWYLLAPGWALATLGPLLWLHRARRAAWMTAWGILVLLAEIALVAVILQATIVPLNHLITNLSGGK